MSSLSGKVAVVTGAASTWQSFAASRGGVMQ